jgi:two-component system chemotaxis sensor kinase CheA
MDDLLREFLTETNERLDVVDVELVRFEQDPNNANILANIFRDVGHYLPLAYEDWLRRKDINRDSRPRTLLFVDDSAFFRNMLTPVLKAAGYEVTAVAGAEDALACLRAGSAIDALVTDIEMPGMNGYELAAAVRSDPRTAGMPIIALSSATSPDAVERGRAAGFQEYVAKFDRPGLIAALTERLTTAAEAA